MYSADVVLLHYEKHCIQPKRNLVYHRSMSDKTCLRLVEILGLPVTMTMLHDNVQWCDR